MLLYLYFHIIILIINYFIFKTKSYLYIAICIYFGLAWQVLTLTPKGYLVLLKIDAFLKYFVSELYRGKNNESI